MNRRSSLKNITVSLLFLGITIAGGNAGAQTASDIAAVKASAAAFYIALSARDIAAMEKVWATDADIQEIGPATKEARIGWDTIKKSFEGLFANSQEIKITMG